MPNVSYPLDTTGLSPANKVIDEPHVLTEVNAATYRILILDFAPFYQDNFVLVYEDTLGNSRALVKDVDFYFTLPYLSASRTIGKMIYGAIALADGITNGSLKATYQTLGGDYIADVQAVRVALTEVAYNPRIASWDVIANKPSQFPPVNHPHDISDLVGMEAVVDGLHDIQQAILQSPNPSNPAVQHFTDMNNPHETDKAQVGLGDVVNLPMATDAEVMGHQHVDKYVTLRQVLMLLNL
jgi:hypothetical protein